MYASMDFIVPVSMSRHFWRKKNSKDPKLKIGEQAWLYQQSKIDSLNTHSGRANGTDVDGAYLLLQILL